MTLSRSVQLAAACGFLAAAVSSVWADTYAVGDFGQAGDNSAAGWSDAWQTNGLKLDSNAAKLIGTGTASRSMLRTVDFDRDGEWFFRVTITRDGSGATKPSSHASVSLTNKDKSVDTRPFHWGISSRSTPDFGLVEHINFGNEQRPGQSVTLIARLITRADEPDRLQGWVFDGTSFPSTMPSAAQVTSSLDYDGKASTITFNTGSADDFTASFEDLRIGSDWESVSASTPGKPAAFLHDYRPLNHLRVTADGTHAMPVHWSNISLFPTTPGRPPNVLIQSSHPWMRHHSFFYTAADAATVFKAKPKPNPELPLYGEASLDEIMRNSNYQAVPRGNGMEGYDLFDLNRIERVGTIDMNGEITMLDRPQDAIARTQDIDPDKVRADMSGRASAERFIADVDGDGVADLLLGQLTDAAEIFTYWPHNEGPWVLDDRTHVGPHSDLSVSEGFRGYGVDGEWLGEKRTAALTWMKGTRSGESVTFGERKPVYYGNDDFPVQWRSWANKMSPAVVRTEVDGKEQTHIVLFAGVNNPLALPVRPLLEGDEPGTLRVGKATPLLADGEPLTSLHLTTLRASIDVTGNGRDELVAGNGSTGRLVVMGGDTVGAYRVLGALETVGGFLGSDTLVVPARGDWDGDGIPDLITGDGTGFYILWPGTSDPLVFGGSQYFTDSAGEPLVYKGTPNLQGPHERGWSYSQPGVFDWDNDGELELIGNENTSTLRLHKRIPGQLTQVESSIFTHNGQKLGVGWRSRMTGVSGDYKIAGDDRPVLLFIDLDRELNLGVPTQVGSTEIERIIPLTFTDGSPIITAGSAGMSGRTQLSCPDWDGDGKWDIMYNTPAVSVPISETDSDLLALNDTIRSCVIYWLRNVGTNAEPVFEKPRRFTHKDGAVIRVETHSLNVEPADLDGDGELDLIVGDGPGFLYYLMRDDLAWGE